MYYYINANTGLPTLKNEKQVDNPVYLPMYTLGLRSTCILTLNRTPTFNLSRILMWVFVDVDCLLAINRSLK